MTDIKPAVHPRLTRRLQSLLPRARVEAMTLPAAPAIRLYLINADFSREQLSTDEARALMACEHYWMFCWASGQALAAWLLETPARVAGRTVLDFGTGSGVVGIAAALAGARTVYACDRDPVAREAAEANAALNDVTLSWLDDDAVWGCAPDIVLVSDVLYDRANWPLLARLKALGRTVWVGESRLRECPDPDGRRIDRRDGVTVPELGGVDEFRTVSLYQWSGSAR